MDGHCRQDLLKQQVRSQISETSRRHRVSVPPCQLVRPPCRSASHSQLGSLAAGLGRTGSTTTQPVLLNDRQDVCGGGAPSASMVVGFFECKPSCVPNMSCSSPEPHRRGRCLHVLTARSANGGPCSSPSATSTWMRTKGMRKRRTKTANWTWRSSRRILPARWRWQSR